MAERQDSNQQQSKPQQSKDTPFDNFKANLKTLLGDNTKPECDVSKLQEKYFKVDSLDKLGEKTEKVDSTKDNVEAYLNVFSTKFNVHQWYMDNKNKLYEHKSSDHSSIFGSSSIKYNINGGDATMYINDQKETLARIINIVNNKTLDNFNLLDLLLIANVHYTFAKYIIKTLEKDKIDILSKEEVVKQLTAQIPIEEPDPKDNNKKIITGYKDEYIYNFYCDRNYDDIIYHIHYAQFIARALGIKKTKPVDQGKILETLTKINNEGTKQLLVSIWYLIADKIKSMTKFNFEYSKPEFKVELSPIDIRSFVNNRSPSMKAVNDATQLAASAFISDKFQKQFPGAKIVKTILGQQVGGAPNPNGANLFKTIFERLQSMLKSKQMTMNGQDIEQINKKIVELEQLENTLKEVLGNIATFVSGDYPQYKHDEVDYNTMKKEVDKYNAALADYNSTTAKIMKFFTKINTILISQ